MATINTDAKLRFLRGLEANLPTGKTDGYVYITTDTKAMYVDFKNASDVVERIRIGDVLTVAKVDALPTAANAQDGVLYYALEENILCTPSGSGSSRVWKQINKQSTFSSLIKSLTTTATADGNDVKVSTVLTGSDNTSLAPATVSFTNGQNAKVSVSNGKVAIGAKDTTITGALSVAGADNTATVTLTNTTGGTDASGTALSGTAAGGSFTIGAQGATVGVNGTAVTINAKIQSVAEAYTDKGAHTVAIKDAANNTITSTAVTPKVIYGKDANKEAVFASGNATLSVYTKEETEDLIAEELKTANAMTFKGTLGTTASKASVTALPATAALGDTYIVNAAGSYSYKAYGATSAVSQACKVGDMFIAGPGAEGTDGNLTNLVWTYVPAGNDDLPVASAVASATQIEFKSTLASTSTSVGTIKVGNNLTGSASGTTLTINHATTTTTEATGTKVSQSVGGAATYTAVTGITHDNYGHVTGITTTEFSVVDTRLDSGSLTVGGANNAALVAMAVKDTGNKTVGSSITIGATGNDAIYVAQDATNNKITIQAVWGEF